MTDPIDIILYVYFVNKQMIYYLLTDPCHMILSVYTDRPMSHDIVCLLTDQCHMILSVYTYRPMSHDIVCIY